MRTIEYDVVEIGTKFAVRQTSISGFWIFKTKEVEFLDSKYSDTNETVRFASTWGTISAIMGYCLFDNRADAATLCIEAEKMKNIIERLRA